MNPFDASLENLRSKFVLGAQSRLRRIRNELRRLEDAPGDEDALRALTQHCHRLAGAAATYGFPDVAGHAQQVDAACNQHINARSVPAQSEVAAWRDVVRRLRREFGMASSGIVLRADEPADDPDLRRVLLMQPYDRERDLLVKVLSADRIKVQVASDRATARRAIRDALPDALIVDLDAQGGTGVSVVEYVRGLDGGSRVAALLINSRERPIDKVDAVRCGADALLDAGPLPEQVADRIRALLARDDGRATRILYIEPDSDQAAFVERLLRAAGHSVQICRDAETLDSILATKPPDIILTELVLGNVDGYELAQVLRHDPVHAHIPIIFMTTHDRVPEHMQAGSGGVDDFLIKPVEPRLLLSTVNGRIERARLRAQLAERDGITGVYNHSTFVRRLESWMRTGETHRRPSCLMLVDIDGMATLNRRFGHHVGDQLLRDLARLLKEQARPSQLFGRYGSDEFAAMIYDLEADECEKLANALRAEFAGHTRYTPDGRSFSANFSAGIARLNPVWRQPQPWLSEAEDALAHAKSAGAGQVALPPPRTAKMHDFHN